MKGNIAVNQFNVCLNDRCYDPTRKGSLFRQFDMVTQSQITLPYTVQNPTSQAQSGDMTNPVLVCNGHTSYHLPLFHENRVQGKCLYGYDCETLASDFSVLSGLNTYDFKPFNMIIENDSDATKNFNRDSKLWMYFYYDAVLQLKAGQNPMTVGKS